MLGVGAWTPVVFTALLAIIHYAEGSGNPYMTPDTQQGFNCTNIPSDLYPNPLSCDEYFVCANQVTWRVRCANGLQYNPSTKLCDWPANVHCVSLHSSSGTSQQPPVHTSAGQQPISASAFCSTMADGAYRNPNDCGSFFICNQRQGSLGFCQQGLVFNDAFKMCQDPYYVPACRMHAATSPTTPYVFFTQTTQPTAGPHYTQGSGNPYMTQATQQGFNCMNLPSDFYPNPFACDEYYICANQVAWRVRCANGLQYNPSTKFCELPANVNCVSLHSSGTSLQPQTTQQQTTPPPLVFTTQTWPPQPPFHTTAGQQLISASAFCSTMADGAYRNPNDCGSFFICNQRQGSMGSCPQGLAFNDALKFCQDPFYVPACQPLAG